jgi:hypothetical protein
VRQSLCTLTLALLFLLATVIPDLSRAQDPTVQRSEKNAGQPGPTKKGPAPAVVRGTITDENSGRGIDGAIVRWSRGGEGDEGTTDDDGNYSFTILCPCPPAGTSGESGIALTVHANAYVDQSKTAIGVSGQSAVADFKLVHEPSNQIGLVQGRVSDAETGEGVEGVQISITNAGGELTAKTDADGNYRIPNAGFQNGLILQVRTEVPPCLKPEDKTFDLNQAVTDESFVLPRIVTRRRLCEMDNKEGGLASGVKPFSNPTPDIMNDSTLKWEQADGSALQSSPSHSEVWNSGHLNDVYKLGGGELLVASESGGLWSVATTGLTLPLSTSWTSQYMNSLAPGPDGPDHFYAGTNNWTESSNGASYPAQGGILYETDTSSLLTLLTWVQTQPTTPCGIIYKVVVVPRTGKDNPRPYIVLACDNGVWWSVIPPAPSAHGTYNWKLATGTSEVTKKELSVTFSGLAIGATEGDGGPTIVAATGNGTAPSTVIYWGDWSKGELVLHQGSVATGNGKKSLHLGWTSIASCPVDRTSMFSVSADSKNNNMAGVWSSGNGGRTWQKVNSPTNPGAQGNYNNAVAMSGNCQTVAVGWQSGTFVSYDYGKSWTNLQNYGIGEYNNLHADVHALLFDPGNPANLYIASDGGVALASNVLQGATPTYKSDYNRKLFDMQPYNSGASAKTAGLVGMALQDNGVVYAKLPGGWQHLTNCGCDGGDVNFPLMPKADDLIVEREVSGISYPWNWEVASPKADPIYKFNGQQNIGANNSANNIASFVPIGLVKSPTYRGGPGGTTMYAVTALNRTVYGLFSQPDGSQIIWRSLGKVGSGQSVAAVASYDGTDVLVGTSKGRIYQLAAPYTGGATQLTLHRPTGEKGGNIGGLVEPAPGGGFAIYNGKSGSGYVMLNIFSWDVVGSGSLPSNLSFNAIESLDTESVAVASGSAVYTSHDFGGKWSKASNGLPAVAQGMALHLVTQPDGKKYLYLATYGWSLWRALVR